MTSDTKIHIHNAGVVELGPPLTGSPVIVEGREIPRLVAHDSGPDEILLVLDRRFSITVPRERSAQICWFIANAMAVGAGYPSLNADIRGRPFAPRVEIMGEVPND